MQNLMNGMFDGVMGRIQPGMCRLSMNGRIAIHTSSGYKTYNPDTESLTNCSNFVLDIADDLFMLLPTRKLKRGDIVLINGKPMYILDEKGKNRVEAISYENSEIKTVIPERHVLLGRKFYGKIVSLMGSGFMTKNKGGFFKNMLKFKMMSSMMGGNNNSNSDMFGGGNALPMMMLISGGNMDGIFDGLGDDKDDNFDFNNLIDDEDNEEETNKISKKSKKHSK